MDTIALLNKQITRTDFHAWTIGLITFITGDTLTTLYVTNTLGVTHEANPLIRYILSTYGTSGFILTKTSITTALVLAWITFHYLYALHQQTPLDERLLNTPLAILAKIHRTLPQEPSLDTKYVLKAYPIATALIGTIATTNNLYVIYMFT